MADYEKKAADFLNETGAKIKIEYVDFGPFFTGEKESRDIYKFTIKTSLGQYSGRFGQSIAHCGIKPTAYDILSCLDANCPDDFEDFCAEFGYDNDSRKAEKTFKACIKQNEGLRRIFTRPQLNKLSDIN